MAIQRESNLELFRVIVMLMIIAHHYIVNSGLIDEVLLYEPMSFKTFFSYLFGAYGKVGINCFVLITGYFMCTSSISLRKYTKLVLQVLFYNTVLTLFFAIFYSKSISIGRFIYLLSPIKDVAQGFVSTFLLFYLLIPFLNLVITHLDKVKHFVLICYGLFIYSFIGTTPLPMSMNYVSWFCVLYFIASYLRIYPIEINKWSPVKFWGWAMFISLLLSILSIVFCMSLGKYIGKHMPYWFISDSNKILALTTGVTAFMFFRHLKIRNSKIINILGGTTFGILLIHANSAYMRHWLWKDLFNNVGNYTSDFFYMHAVGAVILIFITCAIIDYLRLIIFEKPLFLWLDNIMCNSRLKKVWTEIKL